MNSIKARFTKESIPALICYRHNLKKAASRGTVLFYHGLSTSKDNNIKELTSLAGEGFLAIGIDNVGHGERKRPDFDEMRNGADSRSSFFEMVQGTVSEIPDLIDTLLREGYANADKIGITGISMGGFIAYGAVIRDRRIKVAAPILGSPEWEHPESPHKFPESFFPAALLSQNAGKDESVPPSHARRFHECLARHYHEARERQKYVEFSGEGHFMSEARWNELWDNTLSWFHKFL